MQAQFDVASIAMDAMNAEEQMKADQEAYELMMIERGNKETERANALAVFVTQIAVFDTELAGLDEEIQWLLERNKSADISAEEKETNTTLISTFRTQYFTIMD